MHFTIDACKGGVDRVDDRDETDEFSEISDEIDEFSEISDETDEFSKISDETDEFTYLTLR